jgi:MerR family mercuric resistance operon transcriptional regulator
MTLQSPLTIGALAAGAGVPTSTVRYYERQGLLRPDARSDGNYRLYRAETLDRLRFIVAAKANGFTLDDVRSLLDLRDGRTAACRDVQELIEERLSGVEHRLAQLRHVREVLRASLESCRGHEPSDPCPVIDDLTDSSRRRPGKPSSR